MILKRAHLDRWFRRIRSALYRPLYRDPGGGLEQTLMLAGAARSGTTWLAELLASQTPSRLIFEPFYPGGVPEFRQFSAMQYVPRGGDNRPLRAVVEQILLGKVRGRWIDHQLDCLRPEQRVVKTVRANLMLGWMRDEFPTLPIIFLVRHPCAVVASRIHAGWDPDDDLGEILKKSDLPAGVLASSERLLELHSSEAGRHALVWSIQHLVPLTQLNDGEVEIIFYENLILQPETEVPRLYSALERAYDRSIFEVFDRPSRMTPLAALGATRSERISRWTSSLDPTQQNTILEVVEAMGLSHLYRDSPVPVIESRDAYLD